MKNETYSFINSKICRLHVLSAPYRYKHASVLATCSEKPKSGNDEDKNTDDDEDDWEVVGKVPEFVGANGDRIQHWLHFVIDNFYVGLHQSSYYQQT